MIETVAAVDNTVGAEAIEWPLLVKVDIRCRKKGSHIVEHESEPTVATKMDPPFDHE